MFRKIDPYMFLTTGTLLSGNNPIGIISTQFQVTHYDDVRLTSGTEQTGSKNKGTRQYILTCTQRVKVYNPSAIHLSPQADALAYNDYPAMLNTSLAVQNGTGMTIDLLDYSPVTVNSQVQSSASTGSSTGQANSSSLSNTIGSSQSQTNNFSTSVGVQMDMPSFSVSADLSTSHTTDHYSSSSTETSRSKNQDASSSASMSIKDWGSYAYVNPDTQAPIWTFGQEYPWNIFECRKIDKTNTSSESSKVQIAIPNAQLDRLWDGVSLHPPSQLSQFGINFVMKAQWRVVVPNSQSDVISLVQDLIYFTASHSYNESSQAVQVFVDYRPTLLQVDSATSLTNQLDLGVLALEPLTGDRNPAIVGFLPAKFTVPPSPAADGQAPVPFKTFSASNSLRVSDTTAYPPNSTAGTGFSASEAGLTASLAGNNTSLCIRLLFKITDMANDYTLHLKHWKVGSNGVKLDIVVNGDNGTTLTKYVDAVEANGGEGNLLSIDLRNLDFASIDYHDYLTLGLNSVDITITPIKRDSPSTYQIRAISIEPA